MNFELLSVRNLSVAFGDVQVTDNVCFNISSGEIFALMGESGCGKSVTAMAIPKLLPQPSAKIVSGEIILEGKNLLELPSKALYEIRGKKIGCVFQEPMQALNPVVSIGTQLLEAVRFMPKEKRLKRIKELLTKAEFKDPERILKSYPHEMSGGMLQRIVICIALAPKPSLVIADEPTTALDANIQTAVMDILKSMCKSENAAMLLITHNAHLAAKYADRIAVMYAGQIAETGKTSEVFNTPKHPYTKALLKVVPAKGKTLADLKPIPGSVLSPKDFDKGCRFRFRCEFVKGECDKLGYGVWGMGRMRIGVLVFYDS
ncbi:MAG: ABC transporter ATP-binding protein [Fibromonadaceae bacterium]|jgi:oligopeptide/dipeptide ABC transporter ATP-binding protein|nr:ABC transporter ATP-binding protein [Fibromonadaceae bacterium]